MGAAADQAAASITVAGPKPTAPEGEVVTMAAAPTAQPGWWVLEMAVAMFLQGVHGGLPLGIVATRDAMIRKGGLYADLCAPGALAPCEAQLNAVDRTFTAIVLCGTVGSLPLGIFMDWMGPARANKYVLVPGAGLAFACMGLHVRAGWLFTLSGCVFAMLCSGICVYACMWLVPHALRNRPKASIEHWMTVSAVVTEIGCVTPVGFAVLLAISPWPLWGTFAASAAVLTLVAVAGLNYVSSTQLAAQDDDLSSRPRDPSHEDGATASRRQMDAWMRGIRRFWASRLMGVVAIEFAVVCGLIGAIEVASAYMAPTFGEAPEAQQYIPVGIAIGGLMVAAFSALGAMQGALTRFGVKLLFAVGFMALWLTMTATRETFWIGFSVACAWRAMACSEIGICQESEQKASGDEGSAGTFFGIGITLSGCLGVVVGQLFVDPLESTEMRWPVLAFGCTLACLVHVAVVRFYSA